MIKTANIVCKGDVKNVQLALDLNILITDAIRYVETS